jgi:hypothetical protein
VPPGSSSSGGRIASSMRRTSDGRLFGGADRLEGVRRVVPACDADNDRHPASSRSPVRFLIFNLTDLDHLDA